MKDLAWVLAGLILALLGSWMYSQNCKSTIIVIISIVLMAVGLIVVNLEIYKEYKEEEPRKH